MKNNVQTNEAAAVPRGGRTLIPMDPLLCLPSLVAIPVYVKQSISFFESGSGGRLDLTAGPKQTMGKTVEGFVITIHMPKAVLSASLTATQGSYTYDPATKVTIRAVTFLILGKSRINSINRFSIPD